MSLLYEIPAEKNNATNALSAIRKMCSFMERKEDKDIYSSETFIHDRYLCPCGMIDVKIHKTRDEKIPYPNRIVILSHGCSI